jgi:hypothetical protein
MTVNVVDGQLKVTLTDTETVRFNIDRVFFDKTDSLAAKALSHLLKTAAAKANFTSAATRFAIELYPVISGGCEVWYIPQGFDRAAIKRRSVFEFDRTDGLLAVCEALYHDPKTRYLKSSAYINGGKCRLLVTGLEPKSHKCIALGFADRCLKSLDQVKTLEHWQCVCPKNAIAVIGAAMCRDISQD